MLCFHTLVLSYFVYHGTSVIFIFYCVFSSCFQNVHIVLLFALFLLYISAVQIYHVVSQLSLIDVSELLLLLQPAAGCIYVHVTWYACRGLRVQN